MLYQHQTIVQPASEPVTLEETKMHLRVDTDADDDLITALITAARQFVEEQIGRSLITQTRKLKVHRFPSEFTYIYLPRPPIQSVTQIQYFDNNGVSQILDPSIYQIDLSDDYGILKAASTEVYPTTEDQATFAFSVTYVSGYANAAAVPLPIKQAILILISQMYENRDNQFYESSMSAVVSILLHYYRSDYPSVFSS